eukprot:9503765-Pyramimonas_sp.AAC.4
MCSRCDPDVIQICSKCDPDLPLQIREVFMTNQSVSRPTKAGVSRERATGGNSGEITVDVYEPQGVVWSSEDAQWASTPTVNCESRFPEAIALVRLNARSDTQELSVLGPLAIPVYCEVDGR